MINVAGDVYFDEDYINLYLKDDESVFKFSYEENGNKLSHVAIKRPIKKIANSAIHDGFFDLETVYGYGGFLTNSEDERFLTHALEEYAKYCNQNNIIAEFVRYHPFQGISETIKAWFDFFSKDRDTVVIDLSGSKEERWASYGKKTRNILRRCGEQLVFNESKDITAFLDLYFQTMKKNTADEFYFFQENYFHELLALDNVKLYEVSYSNAVVSTGFFMFGDEIAHYHLSGNNAAYTKLNGNYFLLDSVCDVMRTEYKMKHFHLGGGRTNLENDSLLRFKKKFAEKTLSFCIAGKVYNRTIYEQYNRLWLAQNEDASYFLKYRL